MYAALFTRLGAAEVFGVRPETREAAADPAYVDRLGEATGIFMTGGNQLKLSAIINGTPFGEAIKDAHARGVTVGGTSAGASIQSSHMVAFGSGGTTPKQRMTQMAAGLGLVDGCVIDQHFAQRNRYGRLLMVVAQSPNLLGIGIDEDTAAVITSGHVLDVIGRGAVTIVDGMHITSNAHQATPHQAVDGVGCSLACVARGCQVRPRDPGSRPGARQHRPRRSRGAQARRGGPPRDGQRDRRRGRVADQPAPAAGPDQAGAGAARAATRFETAPT